MNIAPVWSGPPSADSIRALDRERLLRNDLFADQADEADLATAKALLAERSAEELAVALVRLCRQRLPEPEEIADPGFATSVRQPREREKLAKQEVRKPVGRQESGGGTWFRLNIGRSNNADPKWLLPMLCRRGGVTKQAVGAIRIFERETKVQIKDEAASRFARGVREGDTGGLRIEPFNAPDQRSQGVADQPRRKVDRPKAKSH